MKCIETYKTVNQKKIILQKLKEKNFELITDNGMGIEKWYNPSTEETVILEENNRG